MVVDDHEHGNCDEAPQRGFETGFNVCGTQARTDQTFFNDFHRSSQRTGTKQQGCVGSFNRCHTAGNLNTSAADFLTDYGSRHDFALTLFKQDNGHAFADVFTSDVFENTCALSIQRQVNRRLMRLVVKARLSVVQVVTGQDDLTFNQNVAAFTVFKALGTERNRTLRKLSQRFGTVVDHTNFKRCSTT